MSADGLRREAGVERTSFGARGASALALLCLVACGGGGGAGQPTLTLSPQTATAVLGGPAVTFTASLSGSSSAISWTLSGPGSIVPSGGSTAAYTPPPFGGTAVTATVTASAGGGLSASATVHVGVPAAIDVSGRVIGSDLVPIAGINVTIGARSALTDVDGGFTISSVSPPYDLTAVATSPKKVGVLYQGLTRRDPTILMPGVPASTTSTGTLTGNVTGGSPLGAADEVTRLIFGSPEIPDGLVNSAQTNVVSNPYALNPSWVGPSATTGTLHVLQWRLGANNLPAAFTGYASTPGVNISPGGTASVDLIMSAPPASTIGGTIHLAPSLSYFSQSLSIAFPGTPPTFLGADAPSGSFSYPFPDVSGATATLIATALYAGSNISATQLAGISPGTTNVVVDLPTPCTAVAPADHATNVGTTTDFTWTPMTGTVYELYLLGFGTSPSYFVMTAATSARIPDLASQGLGLSGSFSWNVNAFGPVASVDDLAGAAAMHLFGAGSYFAGTTSPRDFNNP